MGEIHSLDAVELAGLIASGHLSAVEAVEAALRRLAQTEPHINAFSAVLAERALEDAHRAERLRAAGEPLPPLFGVPVSIKDLIAVAGAPLAFGSRLFAGNRASEDAPAVERLRAAGAIVIGKTTTSELGCKAVGDSPLTGATRSPSDLAMTAGGSSAGAAASVAAGVTAVAIGTDGGGSIRIPAALNGLVGFKAQFGRIPVYPRSATPELAHVAPIARSVRDVALLLSILSGHDPRDPGSLPLPVPDFIAAAGRRGRPVRIAWSASYGYARPEPEVAQIAERAVRAFEAMGCVVEEVETPVGADPAEAWALMFYANVALRLPPHPAGMDPAVLPLVHAAEGRTARAYCEALAVQRDLKERLRLLFSRYDVLASPTLPVSCVPVGLDVPQGQQGRGPVTWASYTYPFNLSGHPAASLPAGRTKAGHPVGLQLVGPPFGECDLLTLAGAFEAIRPWGYPEMTPPAPNRKEPAVAG